MNFAKKGNAFRAAGAFCIFLSVSSSTLATGWEDTLQKGENARQRGDIQQSINWLNDAVLTSQVAEQQNQARLQLGLSLIQGHRFADAEIALRPAYENTTGVARIPVALALGNVALHQRNLSEAKCYYEEVISLSGDLPNAQNAKVLASINLARLIPLPERMAALKAVAPDIDKLADPLLKARAYLNVGNQARLALQANGSNLSPHNQTENLQFTYRMLSSGRELLQDSKDKRLHTELLDGLSQLYEDQRRNDEALQLTQAALSMSKVLPLGVKEDLLMNLEWRAGRLHRLLGHDEVALGHYQKAAEHAKIIRQDIPIEDEEGQSTYGTLLKPLLTGLTDLLLKKAKSSGQEDQIARLRLAIETVELTRQAEMQDFLGERCAVEAIGSTEARHQGDATAVLYPILFPDRIEVLLSRGRNISRHTVNVPMANLRKVIIRFRNNLQEEFNKHYLSDAQRLYEWLLQPFEKQLSEAGIQDLIIVPDGMLRLIPFGTLHDGQQFVAQKYAVSLVTGISMTDTDTVKGKKTVALLAGSSEPGPVVDMLPRDIVERIIDADPSPTGSTEDSQSRSVSLKKKLALPGVKREISALQAIVPSTSLLDEGFTLQQFIKETKSDEYRILHIASHGFFGGSAQTSFLMAYDDILKMNDLQSLIAEGARARGIELLTLSACQTAEGDDRAPLGISGAAIKAKAKSVIGTLWSVDDTSAQKIMEVFYANLATLGKSGALALAQRTLIENPTYSHPAYWSPFILIGNWH